MWEIKSSCDVVYYIYIIIIYEMNKARSLKKTSLFAAVLHPSTSYNCTNICPRLENSSSLSPLLFTARYVHTLYL